MVTFKQKDLWLLATTPACPTKLVESMLITERFALEGAPGQSALPSAFLFVPLGHNRGPCGIVEAVAANVEIRFGHLPAKELALPRAGTLALMAHDDTVK